MTSSIALSKEDCLMILAVHPDDETLATAGLLQQAMAVGAAVRIIFITDGDNNPWPQRFLEGRWRINKDDRLRWGMRRRGEALTALAMLGIDIDDAVFLGLPDQDMTALLTNGDEQVIAMLAKEFKWQPSLLVVPALQDRHPDHSAVAVLADLALKRLPRLEENLSKITYLIHGQQIFDTANCSIKLTSQQLDKKREAILCHATQTALGRRRFLRYAKTEETFSSPQAVTLYQPKRPSEGAVVKSQTLKINMQISRLAGRLTDLNLYLIAEHSQRHIRFKMVFRRDSQTATVIDSSTGNAVAEARINIRDNMVEATIPLGITSGAENIYLKLEPRWGFYDLTGWHHLLVKSAEMKPVLNTVGVIPCYDVEDFCEKIILQAINFVDHIIVIDDGSTDNTSSILSRLATGMPERISVITFSCNQGKGVGLITGFCEALNRFDFKTLITLDSDGQHPPAEIPHLVAMLENGAEMVIGGRQLEQMPGRSRLGNTMATLALRGFYREAPNDTQSGLRAFKREFVQDIVNEVPGSRYETEFQILLLALSQGRKIASVPIPTIYIDNNRSSKFRPITDSLNILWALVRWRFSHA